MKTAKPFEAASMVAVTVGVCGIAAAMQPTPRVAGAETKLAPPNASTRILNEYIWAAALSTGTALAGRDDTGFRT